MMFITPEEELCNRLRRSARRLALLLTGMASLLLVLYALWWLHAATRLSGGDEAIYAKAIQAGIGLSQDAACLETAESVLRIVFSLALAGWIVQFVRYGYHLCARARLLVPGAIRQHPHRCVLWLLVPLVNVWMTFLVLRAAHRMQVRDAQAKAPGGLLLLIGVQLANWAYNLFYLLALPQAGVENGYSLLTVGQVQQILQMDLARCALLAVSYLTFSLILSAVSRPADSPA